MTTLNDVIRDELTEHLIPAIQNILGEDTSMYDTLDIIRYFFDEYEIGGHFYDKHSIQQAAEIIIDEYIEATKDSEQVRDDDDRSRKEFCGY